MTAEKKTIMLETIISVRNYVHYKINELLTDPGSNTLGPDTKEYIDGLVFLNKLMKVVNDKE